MDCHDIAGDSQKYESVLQGIYQPTLVVTIDSDILYPPVEQQELVNFIPNAQLAWLKSTHGHDAFLIDMTALNELVVSFRKGLYFTISVY
jgi:homoserine O-acetyltransferase